MWQFLSRISRKALVIGGLVLGVVLLTGIGLAAAAALHGAPSSGTAAQATGTRTPKPGQHARLVKVVSVDASNNTITVTPAGVRAKGKQDQQKTLTVNSDAKITKYGQAASFKDIQPDEFLIVAGKDAQHIQRVAILGYGAAGTIQKTSSSGVTIQNAQGQTVTINVSSSTKIIEGHRQATLADLQPGEMIEAFGDKNSDGSLNAMLIHVHLVHGQVTAINGNTITLSQGKKGNDVTVTTSGATTYYAGGQQVPASTLQVGDTIGVAGAISDKTSVNATAIFIREPRVAGKVTAVNGNTITLQAKGGATWTITVNSSTQYRKSGQAASLADVQVGSVIEAVGPRTGDNALTALVVRIAAPKK